MSNEHGIKQNPFLTEGVFGHTETALHKQICESKDLTYIGTSSPLSFYTLEKVVYRCFYIRSAQFDICKKYNAGIQYYINNSLMSYLSMYSLKLLQRVKYTDIITNFTKFRKIIILRH